MALDNRYTEYWIALLHGDMGRSFRTDRPVIELILERYPATIQLASSALFIAVLIAIPLGVVAGKESRHVDRQRCFGRRLNWHQPAWIRYWANVGLRLRGKTWLACAFGSFRLD